MPIAFSPAIMARLADNGRNDPERIDRRAVAIVRTANREVHFYLSALYQNTPKQIFFGLADTDVTATELVPGPISLEDILAIESRGIGWKLEIIENDDVDERTIEEIICDAAEGLRRDVPRRFEEKDEDPHAHLVKLIGDKTIRALYARGFEGVSDDAEPIVHLHDGAHRIHFYLVKSTLGKGFHGLVDLNAGDPRIGIFDYRQMAEAEAIGAGYELVADHEGEFRKKRLTEILEELNAAHLRAARTDSRDPE